MVFVGPTPETIYEAQRHRMIEDVQNLLSRQFNRDGKAPVSALSTSCSSATEGGTTAAQAGSGSSKWCRCRREESICIERQ